MYARAQSPQSPRRPAREAVRVRLCGGCFGHPSTVPAGLGCSGAERTAPAVSRGLKLAVLLTVITAIIILVIVRSVPKAQRPTLPTVVTTTKAV